MYFWHSGVLTPDIDKTVDFFCAASGIARDRWSIRESEFPQSKMVSGNGGKLRVAFARIGGTAIELLQPLDDISYHAHALKARGPGFHHNAYVCEENMDETLAALYAAGGRPVWELRSGDEHACYVETADGGLVMEIINFCPFMPE